MSASELVPGKPYTVLARRFRPQTFDEVVGQQQIGQAIRNAITSGRVAHAYLFTGARGVGKTSTARIFAKALNCPNVKNAIPCNECDVCQSITAGSDVDVLEIDGASNRGIDDIRTLRSNVNVRSMRSPHKVYIIDEVHMLTKEAFNALLKTLEEPPPNVKFVFCTTEPNKVPDTILSRCQRFDFGFIASEAIEKRLADIAEQDGIAVDPAAVSLVARRAGGSMRDSQSLFDQLLAFGSDRIVVEDVHRLLGTAPDDRLFALFDAIQRGDRGHVLELLDQSLAEGVQVGSFTEQLLSFLRDLMIAAAGADRVPLLSVGPNERPRLMEFANRWGMRSITAGMQILTDCRGRMQRATYGRALLELALVRLTMLEELESLGSMTVQMTTGVALSPSKPVGLAVPASKKNIREPAPVPASPIAADISSTGEATSSSSDEEAAIAEAIVMRFPFSSENLPEAWPEVLRQLPDVMASHVRKCSKCAISGPTDLEISFTTNYFLSKAYCERSETVSRLQAAAREVFGQAIRFIFRVDSDKPQETITRETAKSYDRRPTGAVQNDPFVQHAVSVFGGSVVELREMHRPSVDGVTREAN